MDDIIEKENEPEHEDVPSDEEGEIEELSEDAVDPDSEDSQEETEGEQVNDAEESSDEEDMSAEDSDEEDEDEEEEQLAVFQMPLEQVVEAILFSSDVPLNLDKIAKAAGKGVRRDKIIEAIESLNNQYEESARAFEIVEVADKFQFLTRPEFAPNLQRLFGKRAIKEEKEKKLSPAALDTLAIIAYKQPVTRAEVEAVRGVGCGQIMRQLMERGSIHPVGKKMDAIGYPLLYGTTTDFLEEFGLGNLEELPMVHDLRRVTGTKGPLPGKEVQEKLIDDDEAAEEQDISDDVDEEISSSSEGNDVQQDTEVENISSVDFRESSSIQDEQETQEEIDDDDPEEEDDEEFEFDDDDEQI